MRGYARVVPFAAMVSLVTLSAALSAGLSAGDLGQARSLPGQLYQLDNVDQASAERAFASARAGVYFRDLRLARVLVDSPAETAEVAALGGRNLRAATVGSFLDDLEAELPGYATGARGEYVVMVPVAREAPHPWPSPRAATSSTAKIAGVVFSEPFETDPWSRWVRWSGTPSGDYQWERTTCDANGGEYSLDAVRG